MPFYFIVNGNGKVTSTGYDDIEKNIPEGAIICNEDIHHIITRSCGLMYWIDNDLCFPQSDYRICEAFLSMGTRVGQEIIADLKELRTIREEIKKDIPKEIDLNHHPFFEIKNFLQYEFNEVPGLILRNIDYKKDFKVVAEALTKSGLFRETCDEDCNCYPAVDHPYVLLTQRMSHFLNWNLILEYKGKLLQYELVSKIDTVGNRPTITLTVHFNRTRPHWFWKEVEKPIFDRLASEGYNNILFRPTKERPDWKENLIKNYNAKDMGEYEKTYSLSVSLREDNLNKIFKGWPSRRTLGDGWEWVKEDIKIKEARENELNSILNFLKLRMKDDFRYNELDEMFDCWWNLDKASVLMIIKDGELYGVRLIRSRSETLSGQQILPMDLKITDDSLKMKFAKGLCTWHKQVGYNEMSLFYPKEFDGKNISNTIKKRIGMLKASVYKEHNQFEQPLVEIRSNVDAILEETKAWE